MAAGEKKKGKENSPLSVKNCLAVQEIGDDTLTEFSLQKYTAALTEQNYFELFGEMRPVKLVKWG